MKKGNKRKVSLHYNGLGLVQLRKAISILEFIIQNESIESVKKSYEDKMKELKGRLKNR